ncbi:MAG: hypothetical protein ACTHNN_16440 [Xanthobacteraceae bacterium]
MDRHRENAWLRHQQERWLRPDAHRWLRPDAHRWLRPDAARFVAPGSPVADAFPALSLKYNPNQPRVPAGNSDGGQWTDGGSNSAQPMGDVNFGNLSELADFSDLFQITPSETDLDGVQLAGDPPEGIGHNQGPPLDEPPEIPQQLPATRGERMDFVRDAVSWIGRVGRYAPIVGAFLETLDEAKDLKALADALKTANDPPAELEELQARAQRPSEAGYEDHHIVGQFAQNRLQFGNDLIDSPENKVRLPTVRHRDINGWYSRPNEEFDGLSPRDYLRGKSWDEQMREGLKIMRRNGVLK